MKEDGNVQCYYTTLPGGYVRGVCPLYEVTIEHMDRGECERLMEQAVRRKSPTWDPCFTHHATGKLPTQ